MTSFAASANMVRQRRLAMGLTQAELAMRAGISRTAVTAIEGNHLSPSVDAALALASALNTTVENLFRQKSPAQAPQAWAWTPERETSACWRAEVLGKIVMYPASAAPMLTLAPDQLNDSSSAADPSKANETLVIACCDPAAGLLASQYATATGMRLIVLERSSRQSLEMLKDGLVHLAGVHLSTAEEPNGNIQAVESILGPGFQLVRVCRWQEGIVTSSSVRLRSWRTAVKSKLNWVGREPGSGARQCLDRLLGDRSGPRLVARDHRQVVDAVRSGWADAGICVQLAGVEAGLDFLPVQEEAFDVCFPSSMADDRRIKAFLSVVRSASYRKLLHNLPGYSSEETGSVWEGQA